MYSIIALVTTLILNGIGMYFVKPEESKMKYDYLSTRFQQLAAAIHYHPESFTEEELRFYDSILGLENNKNFSYSEADPIKNRMNNENFRGNGKKFFEIWLKGYTTHPKTYLDAVLNLSVSYWYIYQYPDISYTGNYYQAMYSMDKNWYDNDVKHDERFLDFNEKSEGIRDNAITIHKFIGWSSVLSIFYKPGMFTILLCVIFMLTILKKRYNIRPLIFLCITVVLTCVYSPIVNYFRYSYIFMMLIPIILPLVFVKEKY